MNNLDKIIEYCHKVSKSEYSVDRLMSTTLSDLATTSRSLHDRSSNPLIRTHFVEDIFGDFMVEAVSPDAKEM